MQISFYVLNNPQYGNSTSSSSPHAGLLDFVCKLTQTVLKKSELGLVIVDDDPQRLALLDDQLWHFDAASFIPHSLIKDPLTPTPDLKASSEASQALSEPTVADDVADLTAPVILTRHLPVGFDGVILNLAATPLALPVPNSDSEGTLFPERVLEIIAPDDISKQQGRDKYQHYKSLGFELIYYPIN